MAGKILYNEADGLIKYWLESTDSVEVVNYKGLDGVLRITTDSSTMYVTDSDRIHWILANADSIQKPEAFAFNKYVFTSSATVTVNPNYLTPQLSSDPLTITANVPSTSPTTGSVVIGGGLGVHGDTYSAGNYFLANNRYINLADTQGSYIRAGVGSDNYFRLYGTTSNGGSKEIFNFTNYNDDNTLTITSNLIVADKNLYVGGSINSTGAISTSSTLSVTGNTTIQGTLSGVGLGLRVYDNAISTSAIELGYYGTGARNAFIDFHNADSPSDYTARIIHPSGQTYLNYHNQVGTHYFTSADSNTISCSGGMAIDYDNSASDTSGITFYSGNGSTARSGRTWLLDIANNAFRVVDATGGVARAEFIAGGTLNINSTVTVASNLTLTFNQVQAGGTSNLHLDSSEGGSAVYLNYYGGTGGTYFGNGNAGSIGNIDSLGNLSISGALSAPGNLYHRIGDNNISLGAIEINRQGTGDRSSFIDFHSSGTPASVDYSARIIRNSGVDGAFDITQTGTGAIRLTGAKVQITDTTGSSSTTTGALVVSGGVGVAENIYVGGDISADILRINQIIPKSNNALYCDFNSELWDAGKDDNVYYQLWQTASGNLLEEVPETFFKLGGTKQYTSNSGSPLSPLSYTKVYLKGNFNIQVKWISGSQSYTYYLVHVADGNNPPNILYSDAVSLNPGEYIVAFYARPGEGLNSTVDLNGWYTICHDEPSSQGGAALQMRISLMSYPSPEIQAL